MASKEEIRRVSIFINGTEADLTLKQLEKGAAKLKNELGQLVPGTEAFRKKLEELRETRQIIQGINDDIRGVGGAFGWLKTEIGKLGVLAAGYMGFDFVTTQFQNIISQNAKLSDSIADIQKTTGLSETSVRRLQSSFKELDTRSSTAQLNGLAEVAGKLGISAEEDVLAFVRAADQINIALGKDLGNAEQAVNDLGKITEIFKVKDAYGLEQALLKTGSAINDLGAAGTANEGYLVEFTKRLGGVAPGANVSLQSVLGLAATMDELGQPVEAAATAIGQFIIGLGQDIPRFAKIAGMSVKAFSDLLKTDGNQALIAVLKNLKSTGEGVEGLAANMGLIGEEGARATAALGLLSNNIELVEKRQQLANTSFEKGTSLTQEFETKNNNFAATLDKLIKKIHSLVSNTTVTSFMAGIVEVTGKGIDALNRHAVALVGMIKMIITAGVAWITYRTYVAAANSAQLSLIVAMVKGESVMALSRTATIALAGAKALFTGNLTKASQAMRLLNTTMAANPIGAMIAALAAVITYVVLFKDSTTSAAKAQETLNKVRTEGVEKVAAETDRIKALNAIITDSNEKYATRIRAIQTLRSLMPDHLQGYSNEELMANKAAGAVGHYIEQLEKRAEAEVAMEELKRLKAERREIERTGDDLNWAQWTGVVITDMFAGGKSGDKQMKEFGAANKAKAISDNEAQQQALLNKFKSDFKENTIKPGGGTGGDTVNENLKITRMTVEQLEVHIDKLNKQLAQTVRGTPQYAKIAAELKAANAQMKAIKKDTGVGDDSPDKQDPVKVMQKKSADLSDIIKKFNIDRVAEQASADEKEIRQVENKYDALISRAEKFQQEIRDDKNLSPQQKSTEIQKHQDEIDQLRVNKNKDVNALIIRQEEETLRKIRDLRTQLGDVYDTERQKEEDRINNFYDDLLANASEDYELWVAIEEARAKDLTDAKLREEKRFKKDADQIEAEGAVTEAERERVKLARINKKYDDQVEALKRKYSKELQATKEFQDALALIEKNRKNEIDQSDAENKKQVNEALLQAAIDTARTVNNAIFDIGKQNRDAELDEELSNIDKMREKELSNKNLTEAQKKSINEKYDKQEAEAKLKAWQADKDANVKRAIINGALAVTNALATAPWPLNFINAAAAGVAAAAQVVVISNEKPPKYEDGGYSAVDYKKPQGWVKSPTLFPNSASGRTFSAGENYKTEYIISSEQLKDPVIADFVSAMEANRTVRRFEAGGYSNATVKTVKGNFTSTRTDGTMYLSKRMDRMEQMMERQLAINERQAQINEIPVVVNTTTLDEKQTRNAQIRTEAGA